MTYADIITHSAARAARGRYKPLIWSLGTGWGSISLGELVDFIADGEEAWS